MTSTKSSSLSLVFLAAVTCMMWGCGNSAEENYREEFLDSCARLAECGFPEEGCEASVDDDIDLLNRGADDIDASEACRDQIFDSNATFFACLNRQTCEALDTGNSCQTDFEDQSPIVSAACDL